MAKGRQSAGILLYRKNGSAIEILLVHPGGPYWKDKEAGAWSIPKGEFEDGEDALTAAKREFREETGQEVDGIFVALEPVKQKSGKLVYAWATEGNLDVSTIVSNTFRLEYPYKSGKWMTVPEVDKAGWFSFYEARYKINAAQAGFLDELEKKLLHEKAV